jgi:hypothetical protein
MAVRTGMAPRQRRPAFFRLLDAPGDAAAGAIGLPRRRASRAAGAVARRAAGSQYRRPVVRAGPDGWGGSGPYGARAYAKPSGLVFGTPLGVFKLPSKQLPEDVPTARPIALVSVTCPDERHGQVERRYDTAADRDSQVVRRMAARRPSSSTRDCPQPRVAAANPARTRRAGRPPSPAAAQSFP